MRLVIVVLDQYSAIKDKLNMNPDLPVPKVGEYVVAREHKGLVKKVTHDYNENTITVTIW